MDRFDFVKARYDELDAVQADIDAMNIKVEVARKRTYKAVKERLKAFCTGEQAARVTVTDYGCNRLYVSNVYYNVPTREELLRQVTDDDIVKLCALVESKRGELVLAETELTQLQGQDCIGWLKGLLDAE